MLPSHDVTLPNRPNRAEQRGEETEEQDGTKEMARRRERKPVGSIWGKKATRSVPFPPFSLPSNSSGFARPQTNPAPAYFAVTCKSLSIRYRHLSISFHRRKPSQWHKGLCPRPDIAGMEANHATGKERKREKKKDKEKKVEAQSIRLEETAKQQNAVNTSSRVHESVVDFLVCSSNRVLQAGTLWYTRKMSGLITKLRPPRDDRRMAGYHMRHT